MNAASSLDFFMTFCGKIGIAIAEFVDVKISSETCWKLIFSFEEISQLASSFAGLNLIFKKCGLVDIS